MSLGVGSTLADGCASRSRAFALVTPRSLTKRAFYDHERSSLCESLGHQRRLVVGKVGLPPLLTHQRSLIDSGGKPAFPTTSLR